MSACWTGKTLVDVVVVVVDASNACAIEIGVVAEQPLVVLECVNLSCCALEIVAMRCSFEWEWGESRLLQPRCHVDALHGTFCGVCMPRPSVSWCHIMVELVTHALAPAYLPQSVSYHRFDLPATTSETNTMTIHC